MDPEEILSSIGGRLALLSMALAVVGLYFFYGLALRASVFLRERRLASLRPFWSLVLLLVSGLFFASAAAAAFLSTSLKTYQAFTGRELVARIECDRITDHPDYQLILRYIPYEQGRPGPPAHYLLKGDEWEVGGDILKWDPWLNWVGIRTCHKVTRLSSHSLRPADEAKGFRTSYQLNGGTDELWIWLHQNGERLPFVEAAYGSAVFTFPDPEQAFELYIGAAGYSIKKVPRNN